MKFFSLATLLILAACSSSKVKDESIPLEKVTNESFKKEKPLTPKDVPDFYVHTQKAASPALQDESLDRYTPQEIEQFSEVSDPLLEISLLCSRKEFDRAFAVASKNFLKYQKIPAYWNQVANCHLAQGSYRKALLFYNKALEVNPAYVPALNNIGVMYSRQGQDQKALIAFERANKQSRFAKTPRYNLAKLYLTYGLAESALPLFQGLLSGSEEDVDLLNATASCYFLMSDYQKAWEHFHRIPREYWVNPEIGLNMAVTLNKLNRSKDAHKVFDDVEKPKGGELKKYYVTVQRHLGE